MLIWRCYKCFVNSTYFQMNVKTRYIELQTLCILPDRLILMISTSVWLSGVTGADVWLVAGTGPNRCCWGCSPNTNTWLRTPGTTCYTCRAIIELCGSRADGAKMGFCKKERKTHKCPDLPLHFPPPDNILSPPLKPPEGISQSHFGLSLLNMKI